MEYRTLDRTRVAALPRTQQDEVNTVQGQVKQGTLRTVAILPAIMFVCYLALIFYFRSRGGYKAEVLTGHGARDEEMTGGVPGPVR
jgi:hypothetical protein